MIFLKYSIHLILIPLIIKCSLANLNLLIVSPLLYHSHHTLDKEVAREMVKEHKIGGTLKAHKVHILIPIREKKVCMDVKKAAKNEKYTVECYFKESTKKHWKTDDGYIAGFPDFYQELFEDETLIARLKAQKFNVGLAQLHFFSLPALKLYKMLGIEKMIGITAGSLSPDILSKIGVIETAMEQSVPPVGWRDFNTKIGDSKVPMEEERKKEIVKIYKKLTKGIDKDELEEEEKKEAELKKAEEEEKKNLLNKEGENAGKKVKRSAENEVGKNEEEQKKKDEEKLKEKEEMDELIANLETIFVNSQKELEWNDGTFLEGAKIKLTFIGGFNLVATNPQKKQYKNNYKVKKGEKKPIVLISFGTLIDTATRLNKSQMNEIKRAIRQFPQFNFIWKVSAHETRRQLRPRKHMGHVTIKNWIDQRNELASPNTLGFISHCGRNSLLESVVNAVPLICVPFEVDQYYNAEALAHKGLSYTVDIKKEGFKREDLIKPLEKLLGQVRNWPRKYKKDIKNVGIIREVHKNLVGKVEKLKKTVFNQVKGVNEEIFKILNNIEKDLAKKIDKESGKVIPSSSDAKEEEEKKNGMDEVEIEME